MERGTKAPFLPFICADVLRNYNATTFMLTNNTLSFCSILMPESHSPLFRTFEFKWLNNTAGALDQQWTSRDEHHLFVCQKAMQELASLSKFRN